MQLMPTFTCQDDASRLRDELRRRGYLFLRRALDPARVAHVRALVARSLVDLEWAIYVDGRVLPRLPVHRVGTPAFCKCVDTLLRHEALHELAYEPQLLQTLQAITGWKMFPHPRKSLRVAYPEPLEPGDMLPPHQDFYYVRGGCDTFTVWMPFGNYGPTQGALRVLEGTHTHGLWPTKTAQQRFHCNAVLSPTDDRLWRTASYEMGDVLIFHSLLVHATGVNETEEFRLSADYRYSPPDQVINEEELLPIYAPEVAPWSELTAGWKHPDLVAPPRGLVVESVSVRAADIVHRERFLSGATTVPEPAPVRR